MARPARFEEHVLLERALEPFWAHGFTATSIRRLERCLELRAPAIYSRFQSKERLFLRVLDHYVETIVDRRIATHLGNSADPLENLYRFFESAMSSSRQGRFGWGCLLTNTATELGADHDGVRDRVRAGLERIRSAFEAELVRAQSLYALMRQPEELSHLLLIDFEGLDVLARLGTDEDDLRKKVRMIFERSFPGHPAFH